MVNGNLILDVQHQIPFGMMIVFYIFIAGMAAGLFIFSSLGPVFGMKKMQPLAKPASVMALAAVIPGVIALIVDLGHPLRFYILMYRFNPSSAMSWGTYILTIFSLITMGYIYFLWKGDTRKVKGVGIAGLVAAVSLGLYTGFLIALAPAHPLWNSALVPILFLVSGLVSGLSMISVGAIFFPKLTGLTSDSADEMMNKMKGMVYCLGVSSAGVTLVGIICFRCRQGSVPPFGNRGQNVLLRYLANWNWYGTADRIAVSKQIKGNDGHLKYFKLNWGLCASL